uniref:DUF4417 domain-containing protein n=1 Tax=Eubacterium cellulosolvens TaxID=29322 RepID=UPI00047F4225|nr:DUF4417 domain-containing protein [[Eubacterium] cellulosolvens]
MSNFSLSNEKNMTNICLCKKEQEVQHFFRWDLIESADFVGPHHHPKLSAVLELPEVKRLVTLNNAPSEKRPEECGLCFYTKDSVIERIWNNPVKYLSVIKRFPLVIGLDYSILCNMFYPQQVYNCWRNYVMTYWLQCNHPVVIPNAGYGGQETFSWAFDGLPEDSWLAITTQGCLDSYVLKWSLLNGLHELIRQKHPRGILVYGRFPKEWMDKFPVPIVIFPSFSESRWKEAD